MPTEAWPLLALYYLCLNLNLTRWRRLLQLSDSEV